MVVLSFQQLWALGWKVEATAMLEGMDTKVVVVVVVLGAKKGVVEVGGRWTWSAPSAWGGLSGRLR